MKNQKGVTLASLTIYVIVAAIVMVMLAFLNANFFSRITELTNQTNVTNEYSKFCSSFVRDAKGSDSVVEYTQNQIIFSNGSTYEIRILDGTDDTYAIYKDSIKVCENIKGKYVNLSSDDPSEEENWVHSPYFEYDHVKRTVTVILDFANTKKDASYEFPVQQIFKVGGGY